MTIHRKNTTSKEISIEYGNNNSINVNIFNNKGGSIKIESRVTDKIPGDPGHPIQYDTTNGFAKLLGKDSTTPSTWVNSVIQVNGSDLTTKMTGDWTIEFMLFKDAANNNNTHSQTQQTLIAIGDATLSTQSLASGINFYSAGPEHAYLKQIKRIKYSHVSDKEAFDALQLICNKLVFALLITAEIFDIPALLICCTTCAIVKFGLVTEVLLVAIIVSVTL